MMFPVPLLKVFTKSFIGPLVDVLAVSVACAAPPPQAAHARAAISASPVMVLVNLTSASWSVYGSCITGRQANPDRIPGSRARFPVNLEGFPGELGFLRIRSRSIWGA